MPPGVEISARHESGILVSLPTKIRRNTLIHQTDDENAEK